MIAFTQLTDIGTRPVNEDSAGCFEKGASRCFVVCDGLGGHGMGDVASSVVVRSFGEQFCGEAALGGSFAEKQGSPGNIYNGTVASAASGSFSASDFLPKAFTKAQDDLMKEQQTRKAGHRMKTTAVALITDDKNAYIGHVGDSRCYIFRHNKVLKRTLDHSIPQMMVLSRQLKESQIRNHPDRNIVLRVMGVEWEEPMYELMDTVPLKKCQAFLLCTDGFWELIEESDMCATLKKASCPEDWLRQMEGVIRKTGEGRSMDNYTAIAIWNM